MKHFNKPSGGAIVSFAGIFSAVTKRSFPLRSGMSEKENNTLKPFREEKFTRLVNELHL